MAKFGIGVGEEFPLDDAQPPQSPPPPPGRHPRHRHHHHRHGGWHFVWHVLVKIALIALLIGGIVWLFGPHHAWHGPYAWGPHHFFLFPFFPVLLLVLVLFAFRRGHWHRHGYCDMRRWHDEMHREGGQGS